MTTWELPAETKEFVGPITLTANGAAVTNFEIAVAVKGQRPTTWAAPTLDGTDRGVMVGAGTAVPLVPGRTYVIFARYATLLETPVIEVGQVKAR